MVFNLGTYTRTQDFLRDISSEETYGREAFRFPSGHIDFRGLGVNYGDKKVVENFDLTVKSGESIALVGKIGSGKSTVAKALMRLAPYKGNIYIDGKNLDTMEPSSVRAQMLYIRQNPIPFNRSLYENIVYGNDSATRTK